MNEKPESLDLKPTQQLLLELIRRHGPVSRAELSKLSHLTPGAITQQCRELIFSGLIVEGEKSTGQRGQPSLPLKLNSGGACSIGISFSSGFIDLAIVDFCGKKLFSTSEPHIENQPLDATLQQIQKLVVNTLKKLKLYNARILGVGYAVPGFLKSDGKKRHCVAWLESWRDVDLQAVFEANLPWPTWVENNANASAIGEMYSGQWNEYRDLTLIELGYGIGAGIIADHKLLTGGFKNAGEVGMAFPTGAPRPSYKDLLANLHKAGFDEKQLPQLIQKKEPTFEMWYQRALQQLEDTVMGCLQWLDPQLVIIGGVMPSVITERLAKDITANIKQRLDPDRPPAKIAHSSIGAESASLGAAMLSLYQVIHQ
ncbi:ROK family transcriptional regulator [Proteus sp. ZN5]|uniref:ROK family transcriptional regulator n=1 Tax=Proteus sp. ZN5 TaxID=2697019 RepID=UPI0013E0FB00|nr:ROK family transcriptional regulator [Proteus sp. ZN5]QIG04910.1 ROK family protein [Proteus sp. ZN5]